MATIQTTAGLPAGFKVKPRVQAFADEAARLFGVDHFLTYPGHQNTPDLALDTFASKSQGDRLCEWAIANWKRLGLDYIIWQQRIYNPEITPHWRDMADRGSPTANHRDHVHATFEPGDPAAVTTPTPTEDGDTVTEETAQKLLKAIEAMAGDMAALRKFAGETNEFWAVRSGENTGKVVDAIKSKD